jgi:hypothetical protein
MAMTANRTTRSHGQRAGADGRIPVAVGPTPPEAAPAGRSAASARRDPAVHRGPVAGARSDRDAAVEGGEPIDHPLQAGPVTDRVRIEPSPVVVHPEREQVGISTETDLGAPGLGVLRDVLERLEHREIHGGLHLLRIASDPVARHGDGNG